MRKKLCCLALAVCLCLSPLSGCAKTGGSSQSKTTLLIGVSVYDAYDAFIQVLMDCMKRYAKELETERGVTITILHESAGTNQITQNSQVENFIEAGCDIICVNLVDRTEASVIIDKAEAAAIPILFFNRELVEEDLERWDKLYYVGAPAEESGKLQGQLVATILDEHMEDVDRNGDGVIQYVMLEGEAGHQDAIVRTEYSITTLTEAGYALQRLGAEIANWTQAQAATEMNNWLAVYGEGEIELVLANNDEMALGAVAALQSSGLGREQWPIVVGIDGTPTGMAAVEEGTFAGTVLNDARGQGESLVDLAWALVYNEEMPALLTDGKYIRLPYQIITAENVAEFQQMYK